MHVDYLWQHASNNINAVFSELVTNSSKTIRLTPNHMIMSIRNCKLSGSILDNYELVMASSVQASYTSMHQLIRVIIATHDL